MSSRAELHKAAEDARYNRTYIDKARVKPSLAEVVRAIKNEDYWNENYHTVSDHTDAAQELIDVLLVALDDLLSERESNTNG